MSLIQEVQVRAEAMFTDGSNPFNTAKVPQLRIFCLLISSQGRFQASRPEPSQRFLQKKTSMESYGPSQQLKTAQGARLSEPREDARYP
jgi:hypothetical protein